MKRSYAVVWSSEGDVGSGRLDSLTDRFELSGRDSRFSVLFSDLADATIARGNGERLRGLPVLLLRRRTGAAVKIASLEGVAVLHELAQHVLGAG
jgi:hypothetical protein